MKIIFMLCSMVLFFSGCVQKELSFSIPRLKDNEMRKEMTINIGDVVNFELDSNPTTGYEWLLEYDKNILTLISSSFIKPEDKKLVGAPGKQRFKFKAIKHGETTIKFSYKRPWEKDKEPAKKILCNIKVK